MGGRRWAVKARVEWVSRGRVIIGGGGGGGGEGGEGGRGVGGGPESGT